MITSSVTRGRKSPRLTFIDNHIVCAHGAPTPNFVTVQEVAALLNRPERTVRRWVVERRINAIRPAKTWLISVRWLEVWLTQQMRG